MARENRFAKRASAEHPQLTSAPAPMPEKAQEKAPLEKPKAQRKKAAPKPAPEPAPIVEEPKAGEGAVSVLAEIQVRKQSLKKTAKRRFSGYFEPSDYARWEAYAKANGISLNELVSICMNKCIPDEASIQG